MLDDIRLPSWFAHFRPHQVVAIHRIVKAFEAGDRVVILDAPTGSGKTLIAEAVRQVLRARAAYVCTTKTLQDQFVHDYDYAALLQGRANYPTLTDDPDITAADCNKHDFDGERCSWCSAVSWCPYEKAKAAALRSDLAVVNTAYFLTECNGPGRMSGRDLVVVDECDTLEAELMRYVGVFVSRRRIAKYRLGLPTKVTKEDAWIEWTTSAVRKLERVKVQGEGVNSIREKKYLTALRERLRALRTDLAAGDWIYTGKDGEVSFKPVRVNHVGTKNVWKHGKRWLLMSASVVSPDEIMDSLGCELPWTCVSVANTFEVKNRQVKVIPVADMGRKANERQRLKSAIERVSERHGDERILVHTVSYDLAQWLAVQLSVLRRPVCSYSSSADRGRALQAFRSSERAILVAPSLDRGVDFPDDECRVVVVAKVPFPYLGDRQVSARLHSPGGQTWYHVQTVRSIVQMTGRATRSSTDFSTSYVLDKQFMRLYNEAGRRLFPAWWNEALDWQDRLKPY